MNSRKLRFGLPLVVGVSLVALMGAQCQPQKPPGTPGTPPTTQVGPGDPGVDCTASAAGLNPFTQDELDNNWGEDRAFPTGGVQSVSFDGCDNVAQLSIDNSMTAPGLFQRTEGLKNPPGSPAAGNFGTAVEVSLYLDPAWADNAVRAGLWVVGDDGAGARDELFGILEFTNIEPITSGLDLGSGGGDHEGFRIWDNDIGFVEVGTAFTYGEWVTLRIELDTSALKYNYFVNGALVGSVDAGDQFIREVFLNHFNYGEHTFANLGTESYQGHWYAGA